MCGEIGGLQALFVEFLSKFEFCVGQQYVFCHCSVCNKTLCLSTSQVKGNNQGNSPSPLCASPPTPEGCDAMSMKVEALEGEMKWLKEQVGEG